MFNPIQVSASVIHDKVKADIAQASDAWFIENQDARDKLRERIAEAGRKRKLISYSELVQGIKFECSTISPKPFEIHSFDWTGPQRRMIGHELARITEQTVEDAGHNVRDFESSVQYNKAVLRAIDFGVATGVITPSALKETQ
jgi:hypothetical protein